MATLQDSPAMNLSESIASEADSPAKTSASQAQPALESSVLGSGLWKDFARMVAAVRPTFVLVENVPALRNRGLALVLQDLRALGYDAEWHCIPACALGANHERDRIWIVAYPEGMFGKAIIWGEPYGDVQAIPEDADIDGEYSDLCGHGASPLCGERSETANIPGSDIASHDAGDGRGQGRAWRPPGGYSWQRSAQTTQPRASADDGSSGRQPWEA